MHVTTPRLTRRVVAEALGTALLVATVVGSGIMATRLTRDVGLALLGNTLATGAILFVLILILGPVSGAHFNPVVSAAMAGTGRLSRGDLPAYIAAQIGGGILGTLAAHAMFDLPILQVASTHRAGPSQWLAEAVATFGLLLTIFGALRARPQSVPAAVGLYITAAYWFTASTSFANPAVTIARALSDTFAGIAPTDVAAFILAQCLGALLGTGAAAWLLSEGPGDMQRKDVS
jgi:glycerol uptake facilitator-like aquaporin